MGSRWRKPNVLIVNASKCFGTSQGELNYTFVATAVKVFTGKGCSVRITNIEQGYNLNEEVAKVLWADLIVYQMPVWHMGPPWSMKKYMDEVFNAGQAAFYNEGAHIYGRGGQLKNKHYMISMTWGAPAQAFTINPEFFQGATPDSIFFGFHKANQFMGMTALPSFVAFNVETKPQVPHEMNRFSRHLELLLEVTPAKQGAR